MRKVEFIKMLQQDNETESEPKKSLYAQVIDCTVIALLDESPDFEIDSKVTAEELFKLIEKQARATKKNCVGPFEAAHLIADYLNTLNDGVARLQNTALGMFKGSSPTPRRSRINLDDL